MYVIVVFSIRVSKVKEFFAFFVGVTGGRLDIYGRVAIIKEEQSYGEYRYIEIHESIAVLDLHQNFTPIQ